MKIFNPIFTDILPDDGRWFYHNMGFFKKFIYRCFRRKIKGTEIFPIAHKE